MYIHASRPSSDRGAGIYPEIYTCVYVVYSCVLYLPCISTGMTNECCHSCLTDYQNVSNTTYGELWLTCERCLMLRSSSICVTGSRCCDTDTWCQQYSGYLPALAGRSYYCGTNRGRQSRAVRFCLPLQKVVTITYRAAAAAALTSSMPIARQHQPA